MTDFAALPHNGCRACFALGLLALLCLAGGCASIHAGTGDPGDIDRIGFNEPSGAVFHAGRGTLFVVGDEGDLIEMKTDGTPIRQRHIDDADFEGVTFDPATGLVYVAVERQEAIREVDPDTFKVLREFSIPRSFEGRTILKAGGQGIESIAFVPDKAKPGGGTFFVTNQAFSHDDPQDDSILLELELPLHEKDVRKADARILRCIPMEVTDLSGMHYDAKRDLLVIISDQHNLRMDVTRSGKVLSTCPLPGRNQEGIAFDDAGLMYIAQDSGGIIKMKP